MSGAYEENKLLNRLFGSYRVSFVGGDGCSIDETEGKKLYAANPAEVPIEEGFKLNCGLVTIPSSLKRSLPGASPDTIKLSLIRCFHKEFIGHGAPRIEVFCHVHFD